MSDNFSEAKKDNDQFGNFLQTMLEQVKTLNNEVANGQRNLLQAMICYILKVK